MLDGATRPATDASGPDMDCVPPAPATVRTGREGASSLRRQGREHCRRSRHHGSARTVAAMTRAPLPTWADWCDAAGRLDLVNRSGELTGPCPSCGGTDRLHIRRRGADALVGCRGCIDGGGDGFGAVLREAFPEPCEAVRRPESASKPFSRSPARELAVDCLRGGVGREHGPFLPTGQRRHLIAGEMERAVVPAQHRCRVGIATRPSALLEGNIEPGSADAAVHLAGISRM